MPVGSSELLDAVSDSFHHKMSQYLIWIQDAFNPVVANPVSYPLHLGLFMVYFIFALGRSFRIKVERI